MTLPVDGKTQARSVRLKSERARLSQALEERQATLRRRAVVPVDVLKARARFLDAALVRLADDVRALERGLSRLSGLSVRLGRFLGAVGDVLATGAPVLAWAAGAWLVAAHAGWPPAVVVGAAGAPALALAARRRRTP